MRSKSTLAIVFAAFLVFTPTVAAADNAPGPAAAAAEAARQADTAAQADCAPHVAVCLPIAACGLPLTISGTSQVNSAPFELAGGAYRVDWGMRTGTSSFSFVDLDDAATGRLAQQVVSPGAVTAASAVANTGFGGQTFIYGVKPGRYFLSARAPSDWSVTLTPIAP
jgi:hypothetical protein